MTATTNPDTDTDYMRNLLADLVNGALWNQDASLTAWLKAARLDGYSYAGSPPEADADFVRALEANGMVAAGKLMGYLADTMVT